DGDTDDEADEDHAADDVGRHLADEAALGGGEAGARRRRHPRDARLDPLDQRSGSDAVPAADEDVAQDGAPAEQALERRVGDEAVGAVDRRRPLDLAADAQSPAEHADEIADADREPLGEGAVEHDLAGAGPLAGDETRQRTAADDGDDAARVAGLDVAARVEDARRRGDTGNPPNR